MKYELKIALPMYKIIYSMLFMVIIILVRPIIMQNGENYIQKRN